VGPRPGRGGEPGDHRGFGAGCDIPAGILQKRDEVIAGLAQLPKLEVQKADPPQPVAARQPEQVLGMVVAQDQHARAVGMGPSAPVRAARNGWGRVSGPWRRRRTSPARRPAALAQSSAERFGRPGGGGAVAGAGGHRRGGVKLGLPGGVGGKQAGEKVVAQVFKQQKAVGQVLGQDRRGGQAKAAQVAGHGREGRRVVGAARRVVHQDRRRRAKPQPFVAPVRGVAGQVAAVGLAPAGRRRKAVI
jgi:hypothetical protein